jgi:serine/threonine-protein kinase
MEQVERPRLEREPLPVPGERIGDCYRVEAEIGRGAMGLVLLATDERLERLVAIKLMSSPLRAAGLERQFLREARAMARVRHPRVASIFAYGQHRGTPYFVMEYVEGGSVHDWLLDQGQAPPVTTAISILEGACRGVSAIHAADTVHRDLKPSNLLLDAELRVKVADFGLASGSQGESLAPYFAGTLAYMAPELATSAGGGATGASVPASVQSDVYALGCVAYELLTGCPPFAAETDLAMMLEHALEAPLPPSLVRAELTSVFDRVIMRALAKKPGDRHASVDEFAFELEQARRRSLEPLRILVAEDDADFRELLCAQLEQSFAGASIECVSDGRGALAAFDREPASVVLLDLHLPEIDGAGVTAALRAREDAATVPIILLTGSGGAADWKLTAALGADRFLVKPVHIDDVAMSIRSALQTRTQTARSCRASSA